MQVRLKMDDRALASLVGQIDMISPVQQKQHYRARTKVEWNVFAHFRAGVAVYLEFFQAPPLYLAHSDDLAIQLTPNALSVRPQNVIGDLRQILQVRYVIDLRARRNHGLFIVDVSSISMDGTAASSEWKRTSRLDAVRAPLDAYAGAAGSRAVQLDDSTMARSPPGKFILKRA
jgi:hypothetical protein